ncbi:MAG: hypothetical protein ACTTJH_08140 [Bacteroidales bacterium]
MNKKFFFLILIFLLHNNIYAQENSAKDLEHSLQIIYVTPYIEDSTDNYYIVMDDISYYFSQAIEYLDKHSVPYTILQHDNSKINKLECCLDIGNNGIFIFYKKNEYIKLISPIDIGSKYYLDGKGKWRERY